MASENARTVGERLRKAITEHWVRQEGERTSIRAFQEEMERRAKDPQVADPQWGRGRPGPGVSYPSINAYLQDEATPSLEFLKEAADVLGVRHEWLAFGDREPTVSETEILAQVGREALKETEGTPAERLRERVGEKYRSFWKLPPWARNRFLVILSRWSLSDPEGGNLVETEEGRSQLVELAGDLLWYITLPLNWKPYHDPEHEERRLGTWGLRGNPATTPQRSEERFLDTMLLALDHILLERGEGESIEKAPSSPLRWLRREYETTVQRIEENLPEAEEVLEESRPYVGDKDPDQEETS